jgi:beta-galactosidase
MKQYSFCLFTMLFLTAVAMAQQPTSTPAEFRIYRGWDFDWRFAKTDVANAMMPGLNDRDWRVVQVPHDWSIEGPFSNQYGSGNGYAPGGIAWYRKHFTADSSFQGKLVVVEFDGVYDNSQVYCNGFVVGGRPYGYSSFECDITPYVKFNDADNVLAVRVDHSKYADSRWYTGSGIYRNVRLRVTDKLRIAPHGVYITTPQASDAAATVKVETTVRNNTGQRQTFTLGSTVIDNRAPDGAPAGNASLQISLDDGAEQTFTQEIKVDRPQLWSTDSPTLYSLRTSVSGDGRMDSVTTHFGIRTFNFDPDKGFSLNGKPMKLKGVCIHHDAGALGAAVPEKVLERRLKLLMELGVNAIRTSHNPPAPELLDLCDRLGLLVKDEAFDEFTPGKNKWVAGWNAGEASRWGYADVFNTWAITDISDMVRRDRNHPSIIIWSIGNEVDYANDPFTHPSLEGRYRPGNPPAEELVRLGKPLVEAVKKLDPTRPVSAALATVPMSNAVGYADILDIVGYNYQEQLYAADHAKYPKRVIFGSENNHSYANWVAVRDNPYISGQFLWTGIDYLGEARAWPMRGNAAGLLETTGFKKPLAYFRQSLWSDKPMVYLASSAAQPPGRRGGRGGRGGRLEESWNRAAGGNATVVCYTNCQQVQLLLNDKPIGTKQLSDAVDGAITWTVPFEAGRLKAIGLNNGAPAAEFVLATAGPAAKIALKPDRAQLSADGKDVAHLEFQITDADGVRVPDAQNELTFQIDGPVTLLGIDNGQMTGSEDYRSLQHNAANGRGLAILQTTRGGKGTVTITVTSPGLETAKAELRIE